MKSILEIEDTPITEELLIKSGFHMRSGNNSLRKEAYYFIVVLIDECCHSKLTFYYFPKYYNCPSSIFCLDKKGLPPQNSLTCIYGQSCTTETIYPDSMEELLAFIKSCEYDIDVLYKVYV